MSLNVRIPVPLTHHPRSVAANRPRLLVVEDEVLVSDILREYLGDRFQVTCCADAASALRELGRQSFDIVLLDRILPGGSGLVVAERADRDGVPMVWMSGDPHSIVALGTGPNPLIAKPFRLDTLLGVLTEALWSASLPVAGDA